MYKDINNPAGESIEKDTQVLFRLFETDETMRGHSQDLLARVKKHRFDGLEIDYENIWKNPQLAKKFVRFLEVLVPGSGGRRSEDPTARYIGTGYSSYRV